MVNSKTLRVIPAVELLQTISKLADVKVVGTYISDIKTPTCFADKLCEDVKWIMVRSEYVIMNKVTVWSKLNNKTQQDFLNRYTTNLDEIMILPGNIRVAVKQQTYDLLLKGEEKKARLTFEGTMTLSSEMGEAYYLDLYTWRKEDTKWLVNGAYVKMANEKEIGDLLTLQMLTKVGNAQSWLNKFQSWGYAISGLASTQGTIINEYVPKAVDATFLDLPQQTLQKLAELSGYTLEDNIVCENIKEIKSKDINLLSGYEQETDINNLYKGILESKVVQNKWFSLKKQFSKYAEGVTETRNQRMITTLKNLLRYANGSRELIENVISVMFEYIHDKDNEIDRETLEMELKSGVPLNMCKQIQNFFQAYICLFEQVLLQEILNIPLISAQYDIIQILQDNPYLLVYIKGISIEKCDIVYHLFCGNVFEMPLDMQEYRKRAILHRYLTGGTLYNNRSDVIQVSGTVVDSNAVHSLPVGVYLSNKVQAYLEYQNTMVDTNTFLAVSKYFGNILKKHDIRYNTNIKPNLLNGFYLNKMTGWSLSTIESGTYCFKIHQNIYVMAITTAVMELAIYNTIQRQNESAKLYLTANKNEEYTHKFEKTSGYKLTKEQSLTGMLLNRGVSAITGSAGTGKTTVIKYLLSILKDYTDVECTLLAPTNKASKRVFECTQTQCSTVHSRLRVYDDTMINIFGLIDDNLRIIYDKSLNRHKEDDYKVDVYIIDEATMLSLPLMVKILTLLNKDTKIIFVGDINQLPSVNIGKPFADLLQYTQSRILMECKRVNDKYSILTTNANRFLKGLDLVLGEDCFKQIPRVVTKENISTEIQLIYKEVQNKGYKHEDIQVVTAVNSNKFAWGTEMLNNTLQEIINPHGQDKFYLKIGTSMNGYYNLCYGDKVIETKTDIDKEHYKKSEVGEYITGKEMGIYNGDIGKIVYIGTAFGVFEKKYKGLIMLVEYAKYSLSGTEPYYICYQVGVINNIDSLKYVQIAKKDITIQLAYALTVHKMQGSQCKVCICMFGEMYGRRDFISKNMIYTAITRAEEQVYLFTTSKQIEYASRVDAVQKRKSLCSVLLEN